MAIRVTLHVFSGRENPTWILNDRQTDDLVDVLKASRTPSNRKASGALGTLGYGGFSIEGTVSLGIGRCSDQIALFAHEGIVDHGPLSPTFVEAQPQVEQHLLSTGANVLHPEVASHVRDSIITPPTPRFTPEMLNLDLVRGEALGARHAVDAPPYEPERWNIPTVQRVNNCYNYANNQATGTFAQPGRATGHPLTELSCDGVRPCAQSDGLQPSAGFDAELSKDQGWYVALVIWPGQDYHWYRCDQNGFWSHKPGQTAARNTDQKGNVILDPKTADRGPYRVFCSYMVTKRSVTIR